MNKNQKIVAIITVVVLGLMVLFPPFYCLRGGLIKQIVGYSFIFSLSEKSYCVAKSTLFIQCLIAIIIFVILFYVFKEKKG